MPYRVRKRGNEFVVLKVNPGGSTRQVGKHPTAERARAQQTALRIKEGQENAK